MAKSHRTSFPLILNKSPLPFMVIHYDVWGPSKVPTLSGSRWFVTFIDDCTRMTWLCLMKTKDEVNLLFKNFHKMIETQYNAKVRVLRSDMVENIIILIFKSIWKDMTSFIRLLVPIHHSKMESLNEKISTC